MSKESEQIIAELTQSLGVIAHHDPAKLAMQEGWGDINFGEGRPLFNQVVRVAQEFRGLPWAAELPLGVLRELWGLATPAAATLKQVSEFKLDAKGDQLPQTRRNNILKSVRKACEDLLRLMLQFAPYMMLRSEAATDLLVRAQMMFGAVETHAKEHGEQLAKQREEADAIMRSTKAAAEKAGLVQHATNFKVVADSHANRGTLWLIVSALFAAGTVGTAFAFLEWLPQDAQPYDARTIQHIATRLVVLSILYLGLAWSLKNFRAHRHLCVA